MFFKRVSSRSYLKDEISNDDIDYILKAALSAPSATFCQNSYFVVIKDEKVIDKIAKVIEEKAKKIADEVDDKMIQGLLMKTLRYHTFFNQAPVFILVYTKDYNNKMMKMLFANDNKFIDIKNRFDKMDLGLQSSAAAMENLCLAASKLNLGTCWMSGFLYAEEEINKIVGMEDPSYHLMCGTPLGHALDFDKEPLKRKPLEEMSKIIG